MDTLPLWPPAVSLGFAAAGYLFFWLYSHRLDRQEEAARGRYPAE